jgi:hypothetical protein
VKVLVWIRAARDSGKTLGRPRRIFRRDKAAQLRAEGMWWRKIAVELKVPVTRLAGGLPVSDSLR